MRSDIFSKNHVSNSEISIPEQNCEMVIYKIITIYAIFLSAEHFIHYKCKYTLPYLGLTRSKSLNPVPYKNTTYIIR